MNKNERAELVDWPKHLDLKSIQTKFGTPNWIVSQAQLKKNIAAIQALTELPSRILFPVKANPSQSILSILAHSGLGADCANKAEIEMALLAGFSPKNISYNSPIQDITVCLSLLEQGGTVVLDDLEIIHQLETRLVEKDIQGQILIRVNPRSEINYDVTDENQELMSHADQSSKFGIPAEEVIDLINQLSIPIAGLHVHVGTQMDNLQSFENAIFELHELATKLALIHKSISVLNLGGGLGIPFQSTDQFPSLAHWAKCLQALKDKQFTYFVEPGHSLVGNAVALLGEVKSIKPSRGKRWAILDVGTDQLAKVTLLKWPHRILQQHGTEFKTGRDAIAGPLCFSGDTLLNNVDLDNLKTNDPVVITEAGAYTYSLSNKFNGRLSPGWLVVTENNSIIRTAYMEKSIDNPHFNLNNWNQISPAQKTTVLDPEQIDNLSSHYLSDTSKNDTYTISKVEQINSENYLFEAHTSSDVDFISAPFALRIFGDASIIALLHNQGQAYKKTPVWSRKSILDSFDCLPSNGLIKFQVNLSKSYGKNCKTTLARFETTCGKCSGSFVLKNEVLECVK